jgi:hypothetical protein
MGDAMRSSFVVVVLAAFGADGAPGEVGPSAARLKEAVVIVRPQHPAQTRSLFEGVAHALHEGGQRGKDASQAESLARFSEMYRALSEGKAHGSGWLIIDPDGAAWVVTSEYIAAQAEHVTLQWATVDHAPIERCRVAYVDPDLDLAVIAVPADALPPTAVGFRISTAALAEGREVAVAGFPVLTRAGEHPAYQYTEGIVNNAEFPRRAGSALQHSARIDLGSNGAPLLVRERAAVLGYVVVGVNAWGLDGRIDLNLAIPGADAAAVLERARAAERLRKDAPGVAAALRTTAEALAREWSSGALAVETLAAMASNELVARHGANLLRQRSPTDAEEQKRLFADPARFLRVSTLAAILGASEATHASDVRVEQVDDEKLAAEGRARTVYSASGWTHEITWTFEQGSWRIADAASYRGPDPIPDNGGRARNDLDRPPTNGTGGGERALGLQIGAGFGPRSAASGLIDQAYRWSGTALAVTLDVPFGRYLGAQVGAGYRNKGVAFRLKGSDPLFVDEASHYLGIPALVRAEFPIEGRVGTVRLYAKAGVQAELALSRSVAGQGAATSYFSGSVPVNVSWVAAVGIEAGLGRRPNWLLGLDAAREEQLLAERRSTLTGDGTVLYRNWYLGVHVTYQLYGRAEPAPRSTAAPRF